MLPIVHPLFFRVCEATEKPPVGTRSRRNASKSCGRFSYHIRGCYHKLLVVLKSWIAGCISNPHILAFWMLIYFLLRSPSLPVCILSRDLSTTSMSLSRLVRRPVCSCHSSSFISSLKFLGIPDGNSASTKDSHCGFGNSSPRPFHRRTLSVDLGASYLLSRRKAGRGLVHLS